VKKFDALHKFRKERRRSPRGCFECGDTTHFITDCLKRKKLDSSFNKYDYTKQNATVRVTIRISTTSGIRRRRRRRRSSRR
jgi:hypothetical protein